MSYILSGDSALYYEEYGTGDPLLLFPGLLGTIETDWRRFLTGFSRHFHTIAVDLRGHGRTNNPSGAMSFPLLLGDIHTLLETLEIDHAVLCGYDLGGALCLLYAAHHPTMVRAVIAHATKISWSEAEVRAHAAALDPDLMLPHDLSMAASMKDNHAPASGHDDWRVLVTSGRQLLQSAEYGLLVDFLPRISVPVLLTLGDGDELITPDQGRRSCRLLPQGTLEIFPNTQHAIQTLQKTPFVESVVRFVHPARA